MQLARAAGHRRKCEKKRQAIRFCFDLRIIFRLYLEKHTKDANIGSAGHKIWRLMC